MSRIMWFPEIKRQRIHGFSSRININGPVIRNIYQRGSTFDSCLLFFYRVKLKYRGYTLLNTVFKNKLFTPCVHVNHAIYNTMYINRLYIEFRFFRCSCVCVHDVTWRMLGRLVHNTVDNVHCSSVSFGCDQVQWRLKTPIVRHSL